MLPRYTHCPMCNSKLEYTLTSSGILCPKNHFRYYNQYTSLAHFEFDNIWLDITSNGIWYVDIYESGQTHLIETGENAFEIFNINDMKELEETTKTIALFT